MNTREKAERILAEIAQSDHSDPLDVAGVCQAYLTQRNEVLEESVSLPEKPTLELIKLMAVKTWPDIWEKGKRLQQELGCDIVPPNAECEEAAGMYVTLVEYLKDNE